MHYKKSVCILYKKLGQLFVTTNSGGFHLYYMDELAIGRGGNGQTGHCINWLLDQLAIGRSGYWTK